MAVKKYQKKRQTKKKRSFRKVRRSYASKEMVMYKAPSQMPIPPRFRTILTSTLCGTIAAADAIAAGQYFVSLNGPQLPWTGGAWPHVLTQNITTINPTGYASLCNVNMYTQGRCYGSSISIEFLPQALTDTIEVCVTPSFSNSLPATTAAAMSQPYTKQQFFSSSKMNSARGGAIKNYIPMHKLLGVSRKAVEDDLSGKLNFAYNGDPTLQAYWVVNWAAPDAVNVSAALEYRVKVRYYVELFNSFPILLEV